MRLKKWEIALILCLIFILSAITYSQVCRSERLSITSSAISLTAAKYQRATKAYGVLEDYDIRWTTDPNITVSTTLGLLLKAGQDITLEGNDSIRNFRAIAVNSTSVLQMLYYDK